DDAIVAVIGEHVAGEVFASEDQFVADAIGYDPSGAGPVGRPLELGIIRVPEIAHKGVGVGGGINLDTATDLRRVGVDFGKRVRGAGADADVVGCPDFLREPGHGRARFVAGRQLGFDDLE